MCMKVCLCEGVCTWLQCPLRPEEGVSSRLLQGLGTALCKIFEPSLQAPEVALWVNFQACESQFQWFILTKEKKILKNYTRFSKTTYWDSVSKGKGLIMRFDEEKFIYQMATTITILANFPCDQLALFWYNIHGDTQTDHRGGEGVKTEMQPAGNISFPVRIQEMSNNRGKGQISRSQFSTSSTRCSPGFKHSTTYGIHFTFKSPCQKDKE